MAKVHSSGWIQAGHRQIPLLELLSRSKQRLKSFCGTGAAVGKAINLKNAAYDEPVHSDIHL